MKNADSGSHGLTAAKSPRSPRGPLGPWFSPLKEGAEAPASSLSLAVASEIKYKEVLLGINVHG